VPTSLATAVRDRRLESGRAAPARDLPQLPSHLDRVLALQRSAGNAAVASMLQRDDTTAPAGGSQANTGTTNTAGPPPTLTITAVQQPTAGLPDKAATAAPTGGAHPEPEPGPWQLTYQYQGQRQYLGDGKPPQDSMSQQVQVNLNITQAGPVQFSAGVQGSFDPQTGTFQGAQAQGQAALVANVAKDVQAQLFAQGSAGVSADATGTHGTAGVAGGGQLSYNVNRNLQVFAQVQGGANATQGQGGGPAYAAGAGMTWTFP
jgi:hypothetical protein